MSSKKTVLVATALAALAPASVLARPEYAAKQGTACAACHVNPWGGGPKTVYGKVYGSHNLGMGKFSTSDLYHGSFRGILYEPKKPALTKSGLALMEASASANIPVIDAAKDTGELRAVVTYNAAVLASGVREAYFRYQLPTQMSFVPTHLMLGRFNSPFGLLTDEHRTYTRMQTSMTLNNFEMGVAASGNILTGLTYDLALVNDFESGGNFSSKGDLEWATVLNLRWGPSWLPGFLGASEAYERTLLVAKPYATSLYAVLSLDRLTNGAVPASVSVEHVLAHNWDNGALNPYVGSFFVPDFDPAYAAAIAGSASSGYYALVKYELSQHFTPFYKFDWLALDQNYSPDAFVRHGAGMLWFLSSNLYLDARVEKAFVGRPELQGSKATAAQDDLLVMMRLWL